MQTHLCRYQKSVLVQQPNLPTHCAFSVCPSCSIDTVSPQLLDRVSVTIPNDLDDPPHLSSSSTFRPNISFQTSGLWSMTWRLGKKKRQTKNRARGFREHIHAPLGTNPFDFNGLMVFDLHQRSLLVHLVPCAQNLTLDMRNLTSDHMVHHI